MTIQVIHFKTGKVERVNEGYARNYLFPRKLAQLATPQDILQAEQQASRNQQQQEQQTQNWKKLLQLLPQVTVQLAARASSNGTLYERMAESDILAALHSEHGISLEPAWLQHAPLKQVGEVVITVQFPNHLTTSFHVSIKAS